MSVAAFDFHTSTRFVFGADTIDRLGTIARELGGNAYWSPAIKG